MRFNCYFYMDDAAFENEPASEAARILREIAKKLQRGDLPRFGEDFKCHDDNGNTVGIWSVTSASE